MQSPDLNVDAIVFTQPCNYIEISDEEEVEEIEEPKLATQEDSKSPKAKWGDRQSLYVKLFTEMLDTVLEKEWFLFSDEEHALFERFRALTYPARYLLVRLTLRKSTKWHRSDTLRDDYSDDIDNLDEAIEELCKPIDIASPTCHFPAKQEMDFKPSVKLEDVKVEDTTPLIFKEEEREYIMVDSDDEGEAKPVASSCLVKKEELKPDTGLCNPLKIGQLAQDDEYMNIEEFCETLRNPELKTLAKTLKIASGKTKRGHLISAFVAYASKQSNLISHFAIPSVKGKGKGVDLKPTRQLSLTFGGKSHLKSQAHDQTSRLRKIIRDITGRCIRIQSHIFALFQRLNLVFFRSTQVTQPLLPLILANTKKTSPSHRHYPKYRHIRTSEVFPSREALLAYEAAVVVEREMDDALAQLGRVEGAQRAIALFRPAYAQWERLLATSDLNNPRHGALSRFDEGHVLTRVVYKGAECYAINREPEEEKRLLRQLLMQTKWRTGRRGKWYERLALLIQKNSNEGALREAKEVVEKALDDPKTHLIYWAALNRRLARLDKRLKVPEEDRRISRWILKRCPEIIITGRRAKPTIHETTSTCLQFFPDDEIIIIDTPSRTTNTVKGLFLTQQSVSCPPSTPLNPIQARTASASTVSAKTKPKAPWKEKLEERRGGKSVWQGRTEDVSVEQFALEYYETLGYKGFHTEGRIVMHIFTLLFWSVLFDSDVPGAFETPFQMAPLDLVHDSFYSSREGSIQARLEELEAGCAVAIIEEVDDRERPHKTWATGVRWDDFSKQDAVEIAQGLGGKALAIIGRILCEDYASRTSGVPDLLIWKEGEVRFVEVKGPGDSLQENQKVWIDVFMGSQVPVEVCYVEEEGFETRKRPKTKKMATAPRKRPRAKKTANPSQSKSHISDEETTCESEGEQEAPQSQMPHASQDDEDYIEGPGSQMERALQKRLRSLHSDDTPIKRRKTN